MSTKYNIFLISTGLNGKIRVPQHVFISNNYDTAKMYFQDYIKNYKFKETYHLYKIGTIDKNLKIEECKIYIAGGVELTPREKIKKEKQEIQKALFTKELDKQIEILFGGIKIE